MKIGRTMIVGMVASAMLFAAQGEPKTGGKQGAKVKEGNGEISQVVKTGNEASQLLIKTLGGNMKKHMKAGGPQDALTFCAGHARELTDEVNSKLEPGVSVKRVTLKPRNPLNEAKGDEKEVLEALELLNKNGVRLPRYLVQKTSAGYKYYKPLKIGKKVCLKCHGTNIDPKLDEAIRKNYRMDKARGYKMGDLRGAVVVTINR